MSILTEVLNRKITPEQGLEEGLQYAAKILSGNTANSAMATTVETNVRTAVANAATLADSDMQPFIAPAAVAVATATENMLASLTDGVSNFANPAISYAITQGANALKAEIDTAVAKLHASSVETNTDQQILKVPSEQS